MKTKDSKEKKYIDLQMTFIAGGCLHNLKCWICKKNPAVYNMNPTWVFEPCRECQKEIGGKVHRIKSRFINWLIK